MVQQFWIIYAICADTDLANKKGGLHFAKMPKIRVYNRQNHKFGVYILQFQSKVGSICCKISQIRVYRVRSTYQRHKRVHNKHT